MSVRLILARHGQTPSNVIRALDTRPPGPALSETGVRQADDLAEALSGEPVVGVYASIATRAGQTATAIAARHRLPVQVREGLHEVQVGELEGQHGLEAYQRFEDVFARWLAGAVDEPLPGGECANDLLKRFTPAITEITGEHRSGTIVVVSHGAAIRLAAAALAGDLDDTAASTYIPNCGTVILESDPTLTPSWRCARWTGITQG